MPDTTNSLIRNAGRVGGKQDSTVANLPKGAQLGLGPKLADIDIATPLVLSPIVPILVHSPGMFRNVPHFDSILKALVERHAKEISGIDINYTLEGSGTVVGHDGQETHMPTSSKREQITPTFTWQEITGNLVWNFMRNWITTAKHPDTQAANTSALPSADQELSPQLLSHIAMDVLFIQFDTTLRPENIIDAYFVVGMWPQETGEAGYQRIINTSQIVERQVPFYGVIQDNENTHAVGRNIAEILQLHRVDYNFAKPVSENISSRLEEKGLQREVSEALEDFVPVNSSDDG